MNKKIVSILLSSALLSGTFSTGVKASAQEKSISETHGIQRETMIVTLSAPSLLDHLNENSKKYKNINELILSDEGKEYSLQILDGQESVKKQISSLVEDADFSDSRSFTAITNGFTLTADINDMEKIENISGIDSVSISKAIKNDDPSDPENNEEDYQVTEQNDGSENEEEDSENEEETDTSETDEVSTEESEKEESELSEDDTDKKEYDSFQLIQKNDVNVVPAYEAGYTGKGMLIGIIDSELDVTHKAFSFAPDEIIYDKEYIRSVHESAKLNISPKFSIDDIYYNGKIIYSYDYGENDRKVKSKTSQHGTHVSGIAAGNNKGEDDIDFKGMAYDAQLAFFKISDENNDLKDEYIISALDDVIKISPDVINCSYGAVQYLMHDYEGRLLYEKLINSGIAVVAAAGNEAYNGNGAYNNGVPAWYTTYGTLSLPSSLEGSFSVAASVPEYSFDNIITMTVNNEKDLHFEKIYADIDFDEVYGDDFLTVTVPKASDVSETKYIYFDGIGTIDEFEKNEPKDKIVVINESSISPEKLIKNAAKFDTFAIIIIKSDTESKYENNDIESEFFVYTVENSEKEYFIKHPSGTIRITTEDRLKPVKENKANEIAEFSSYGSRADLFLKPDITAPGDSILSSISYDTMKTYSMLSGTSMSTPYITGAYSIMKQYVTENGLTENMSPDSAEEYIFKLMMSTAKMMPYPNIEENTLYYTPRLQGAGILDLGAAVNTKAVLSVNDKRPKASLLESSTGSYSFEFSATSFSDEPLTFDLEHIIQTDSFIENYDPKSVSKYLNTMIPEDIRKHAKVYFKINGEKTRTLTLAPHSTETIKVIIRLDQDFINERKNIFTNGFYVDGFVRLVSEDNPELSLPFSGFCGNWSDSRIFPENMFSEECEFPNLPNSLAIVSSFDNENPFSEKAGKNIFQYNDLPATIAFGKDSMRSYRHIPDEVYSNPSILLPNIYILRDAMDYTISISDKTGTQLLCQNFGDIPSFLGGISPYEYFVSKNRINQLEQYYSFINNAREGSYLYTLTASTVGTDGNPERNESFAMKINIDNTRPRITDYYLEKTDKGELFLNVEATDNLMLQGINFFAVQRNDYGEINARQEIYEEILSYYDNSEGSDKFADYIYDQKTKKYYFRYSMSNFKDFLNTLKNQSSEIYVDDDVTIIFESDKDFSSIENNTISIEPVDYAFLCGEEQIINLDSYGEAAFTLIDPYGEPLSDIEVLINGKRYFSDDSGNVIIRNLPTGNNRLTIISPYVRKNLNPFYDFKLNKNNYKYSKTIKLYKTRSTDTGTGQVKEPTKIVNFDTGDHNTNKIIIVSVFAMLSSSIMFTCLKRKKHKNKKI